MTMVGIADLKARLSEYLDLVRSGEEVVVTERGKPVATLNRLSTVDGDLDELVRAGIVRPPAKSFSQVFFDRPRPKDGDGSVVQAIIEERREGR